ncbi:MAG: hypothetical protein LBS05_06395 [Tannerellaceae bacterium]|nr:hypothetical protein [Tannerellaceae bacterium]
MDIDDLLTKYFDGETTARQEQELRDFFASGRAPKRLDMYKPLFAYFDQEIAARQPARTTSAGKAFVTKRRLYWSAGVAAAAALMLVLARPALDGLLEDPCLCSANYVVINGRCYTDMQKARSLAFEALREVATPDEEPFPGIGSLMDRY